MNCQNFENVVNDLARNQIMEASVRDQATSHSDQCEMCASRLRAEQLLTGNLKEFAAQVKSVYGGGAPARLEERLLAEFRNHNSAVKVARQVNRKYWAYAGIAAMLLLSVGIGAVRFFNSTSRVDTARSPITSQTPEKKTVSQPTDVSHETVAVENTPEHRRPRKQSPRHYINRNVTTTDQERLSAGNRDNEITTEFYPVGYSSTLSVQDGGQVVRVEMPRSAMTRFGIPVNMDRYDERVKADVLVGTDGLARAIRFVQ